MDIKIYSREDCKFCKDAKDFLTGMEIAFTEELQPTGTVPQIYISGEHIGGYNELLTWAST
tara:strand:- start:1026 stop:1208 length:183 start_codon:yes stop_codon:yes gene_type:complete